MLETPSFGSTVKIQSKVKNNMHAKRFTFEDYKSGEKNVNRNEILKIKTEYRNSDLDNNFQRQKTSFGQNEKCFCFKNKVECQDSNNSRKN